MKCSAGPQPLAINYTTDQVLMHGGLLVVGAFMLHAAKAAQHEKRIVELARPFCAHGGLTNKEMRRLVRSAYRSWTTKEEAVHTVVASC